MAYTIALEPQGKNPGIVKKFAGEAGLMGENVNENVGGMIIFIVSDSGQKQEVSRVAFIRRASKNPDRSFDEQLKIEVAKARQAIAQINDLLDTSGELR